MSEFRDQHKRIESFVHCENMHQYERMLASETDPAMRKVIEDLLQEEYEQTLKSNENPPGRRSR